MTETTTTDFTETDAYSGTHAILADFVFGSPSPQLGSALALNAALEIYADVHGHAALAKALDQARESIPARAAKLRGRQQ